MRFNQTSEDELFNLDDVRDELAHVSLSRDSQLGSSPYIALAILFSAASLLFLISSILNTLFLVIYLRKSSLRNISNRFIVNLTVWNLLCTWVLLPVTVADAYLIQTHVTWGASWCSICVAFNIIVDLSISGSILATLLIALDRFLAITDPLHYHMLVTRGRSYFLIAVSWILGALVGVSSGGAYSKSGNWNVCAHIDNGDSQRPLSSTLFAILNFIFIFLIPLVTLSWAYWRIYQAAQKNSERNRSSSVCVPVLDSLEVKNVSRSSSTRSTSSQLVSNIKRRISNASLFLYKEEARAAKISATVVIFFILCWGPFYCLQLIAAILKKGAVPPIAFKITLLLCLSNAPLSPYIYVYRSRRIQKEILKFCGIRLRPKRTNVPCPRRLTYLPPKLLKIPSESLTLGPHDMVSGKDTNRIFNFLRTQKLDNRRHSFVVSTSSSSTSTGCLSSSEDSALPRLLDQVQG